MALAGGAWPPRYEEIDDPCHAIVRALNTLEGIKTRECCCGHGVRQYWVCFTSESREALLPIVRAIHGHFRTSWKVQVELAPPGRPEEIVWYRILAAKLKGPAAYRQANDLAVHLLGE